MDVTDAPENVQNGLMGRPRAPHGTSGAFRRHKDKHERVCDACQAWKDGTITDIAPAKPAKSTAPKAPHIDRTIDFVQETLLNLQYVEKAMVTAGADKIGPLSKRKSELLRELKDYQTEGDTPGEVDPVEAALANGVDMSNVTRLAG